MQVFGMKDKDKTKDQFINEPSEHRQQVTEVKSLKLERKQSEEKLQESEERLRFTANQIPGTLWTTDKQLRFTLSTGGGCRHSGLNQDKVWV